ncbi:MAG: DoxX family protein [Chlamydiae bacterium]|nr:MAG: DoxX family protein [Chlamydiota bacterium]
MKKYLVLLGRAFYSALFIFASFGHFTDKTINFAASQGVLFSNILVPFSGLLALIGGLSILLGYKARYGAWLLVIFLVPITYMMHKFWVISNPMMHDMQQAMFMKNTALLGAALIITHFGSGPWSLKK